MGLQNKESMKKKIQFTSFPSQQGIGSPPISIPKGLRINANKKQVTKKVNKNPPIIEPRILRSNETLRRLLPPVSLTPAFEQDFKIMLHPISERNPWKEYLKAVVENAYTGSWAKEVAEQLLKNKDG